MLLLCVVGLIAKVRSECGEPEFKEDAVSRVQAGFKTIRKRGRETFDYRKIEVVYSPFLMVQDPSCIEESQLNLEVKSGAGDWVAMEDLPVALGGGKYKWTIDAVPCKDHLIKLWVNGPGGQAALEYPEPILAASDLDIIESKFTPEKPTGLKITPMGEDSVEVSWEPADCATSYDISYGKIISGERKTKIVPASQGSQIIISEGIQPCTEYSINIFSVVGEEEYSADEASETFTTPPDASSASSLEPEITRDTHSVSAKWRPFDTLSCVDKYAVSVCKETEDCMEAQEVEKNDALDYLKYETDNLDHCSPYTLQIQPLYREKSLAPKIVDFRTLSPPAEGISESLLPVSAKAGEAQQISVSWSEVQCAEYYEVFQKVNSEGGDWEPVMQTEETSVTLSGVPCTEYRYGVQVTIDGAKSEVMQFPDAVVTQLDDSVPFVAPNLEIDPMTDGAVLSWDHGACISSYVVKACSRSYNDDLMCEEETIVRDSTVHNITYEIHNLKPCHEYTLEILPQMSEAEFEPHITKFKTAFPAPSPPLEFSAEYHKSSNKVELEWSEVECASGYKIVQMIGNSETTTAWETDDPRQLFTTLESPEPCVTYSYGVAAVVGGEESSPTSWQEFSIPPREGETHEPKLTVLENSNDTISLAINPDPTNVRCQVEVYELRFSSLKQEEETNKEILPENLENGRIILNFPGASGPGLNLEGRIKFTGFEAFSTWIQSSDPSIQSPEPLTGGSMLVPIVIGILVGIVVIVVVVFFVLKKKRNQNKYDAEKAVATKDETQKLNEHADA